MKFSDFKNNQIKKIAYYRYKDRECEHGYDKNDWRDAEKWWWLKSVWVFAKIQHYPMVVFIALASLIASLVMTTSSIYINANSVDLANRPYVSINIENPIRRIDQTDTFYGGDIIVKNNGKTPAANVDAMLYITTEMDKTNREGIDWFKKHLGGRSSVSFIIPDATERAPGFRSLSPTAEYYYFEAIILYEGLKGSKKYWTHIRKVFYIPKTGVNLYPVFVLGEWDRNNNIQPPKLLTEEEVKALIEDFRNEKVSQPPEPRVLMGEKI